MQIHRSNRIAWQLLATSLLMCGMWGCRGEVREEITPVYEGPQSSSTPASTPMAVAQSWVEGLEEASLSHEVEALASSLVDPHVARLYRDADLYRAVVAGASSDRGGRALILTIAEQEGSWSVTAVEAGDASQMWSEP